MKIRIVVTALLLASSASASSHREAPFITKNPKVDGTDFYMFRSYEAGRGAYVTFLANYIPLQDAYGGPNYFSMDDDALYEIHVNNNGDATEDITFQLRFFETLKDLKVNTGTSTGTQVSVPLLNIGPISFGSENALNIEESYTLTVVRGDRRTGTATTVSHAITRATTFRKPADYIGTKTFTNYNAYADSFIHEINIPGCAELGKVFVGQRAEGFVVNLGPIFDLVNLPFAEVTGNCAGPRNRNTIRNKNVTTIALEVPIACLVAGDPVIGAWTTASVRQARVYNPAPSFDRPTREGGPWTQVSRLGHPLVNEVVIGLKDKNLFNAAHPTQDGVLASYVTNPALPELVEILFGAFAGGPLAPNNLPRTDLVGIFLTGITGLNQPQNVVPSEMLRLNTSIAAVPPASQNSLGAIVGDVSGFPNGRRPADDVVDIALRAAMGVLAPDASAPAKTVPFTDCADPDINEYLIVFPYLGPPFPGSNPT